MNKLKAFTLLEVLMVVALVAILFTLVFIAVNPQKNFAETRNSERASDVNVILNGLSQYALDNAGRLPNGVDYKLRMIGTATTGCTTSCGESLEIVGTTFNNFLPENSFILQAHAIEPETVVEESDEPIIESTNVYPKKVYPGDNMQLSINIKDNSGIESVTADMGGVETISLSLTSGSNTDGTWSAVWLVHSTKQQYYTTTFTATNALGISSQSEVIWSDPYSTGWNSPDSFSTPTGQWTTEINAIDGNSITYATNTYGSVGWGQYIYFNFNETILTNRIGIIADYDDNDVNEVQIDVLSEGIWTTVFLGGDEANWNAKWVEVAFPTAEITQARFRYNYKSSGYWYWLYEFQVYQTVAEITLPQALTESANLIQDNYATIHGSIVDDGGEPCSYRFAYGPDTNYTTFTDWVAGATGGQYVDAFISGLTPDTTYYYRIEVENSAGQILGNNVGFHTATPSLGYTTPSGFLDPSNAWINELKAIDNNTTTYASSNHAINAPAWSSYFILTQDNVYTNGIMFNARGLAEIDQAEVDILIDGNWINVFSGPFTNRENQFIYFQQQVVSQARIRFRATLTSTGFNYQLYEFAFRKSSEATTEGCIDLSELVPNYIVNIPIDPFGDVTRSRYAVKRGTNNRLMVYSCDAELNVDISVAR